MDYLPCFWVKSVYVERLRLLLWISAKSWQTLTQSAVLVAFVLEGIPTSPILNHIRKLVIYRFIPLSVMTILNLAVSRLCGRWQQETRRWYGSVSAWDTDTRQICRQTAIDVQGVSPWTLTHPIALSGYRASKGNGIVLSDKMVCSLKIKFVFNVLGVEVTMHSHKILKYNVQSSFSY